MNKMKQKNKIPETSHHHKENSVTDKEHYEAYKIFFGTMVSESRLKIINFLRNGKKNVSEIISELKMDQTHVSHDLQRLRRCGFVLSEKSGKYVYYSLNKDSITPIMNLIDKHMSSFCVHILRDDKKGGESK